MTAEFEPTIELRTAHDVRHLQACAHCHRLGDDRYMVVSGLGKSARVFVHGGCVLSQLGIEGLLRLPRNEQEKLSLGEIGVEAMKAVVAALSKAGPPR